MRSNKEKFLEAILCISIAIILCYAVTHGAWWAATGEAIP